MNIKIGGMWKRKRKHRGHCGDREWMELSTWMIRLPKVLARSEEEKVSESQSSKAFIRVEERTEYR